MNHQLIDSLTSKRDAIVNQIKLLGNFRPGRLYQRFKKCSNKNCHCHQPGADGHGPYWYLSRKDKNQKTITHAIPSESLDITMHHLERHDQFGELVCELVEVNDQLCQARIKGSRVEKKTSKPTARKIRS